MNKIQEGTKIDISPALLGQVRMGTLSSNEWIPKVKLELDARGVSYSADAKLNQLKHMILVHEYKGNVPEGADDKLFYPKWKSSAHWCETEVDED